MLKLGFEPFEVMLTLPLAAPLAVGLKSTVNEVLWPAVNVKGKDRPFRLNPLPLAVAAEIVRLDTPVLVSVSDKLVLLLTWTLPNARLVGVEVSVPCVTPVPDSGRFMAGLEPSEVNAALPLKVPADCGAKTTEKVALWLAPSVRGKVKPLRVKLLPVRVAWETVRLDPPELVRVADCVWLLPAWTFAKFRLLGLAVSWPGVVPVPVREAVALLQDRGRLRWVLEYSKETLPLTLPLDSGAKVVVKLALWPGASVNGMLSPLTLNPVPDTVAWEIVRFPFPVLFRSTDCETLVPIWTLPKFTMEGLISCPVAVAANRKAFNRTNPQPTHVRG
jgi:hypothetical protein